MHPWLVSYIEFDKPKSWRRLQAREPGAFECYIVIVVQVVEADYVVTAREQPFGDVHADESGGAGDQNSHEGRVRLRTLRSPARLTAYNYTVAPLGALPAPLISRRIR